MTRKLKLFILSAIALLTLICVAPAMAQKVEVSVVAPSRNGTIEVGQRFHILLTVTNIDKEPQKITSAGGAEVVYWTLQSSQSSFTSVNGHMSQSVKNTYAVTLIARKKGSYSIGPISVGGVKSNVARYTIVDAGSGGGSSYPGAQGGSSQGPASDPYQNADPAQGGPTFIGKGNDKLFMRASVSKTTAYEQEALVYTVKLYTTYGSIKFIGATEAPKFDGFVIEESNAISNQLTFENYQGQQYATAVIARYIIFPQKSGKLKVIGNKYTVSTDAQEYYHDPYFTTLTVRRPIQLNVTPNDLEVDVKPLPTPRPMNFSGGVGKFNLTSNLKTTQLVANQAASITYTVSGEGNLKYIHLPDLNALYPDELEVFTPTTDVKTNVGASNVGGTVKFDYSFMPLEQGKFTIPAVELVYFNPSTGKYETVSTQSYTVDVARGEESSKSQATLTFNSKLMNVDLTSSPEERPDIRGFLYWLWYIVPAAILLSVAVARRKYIASRADIVGLRSRRAGKMAKRRLKKAGAAMNKGNEDLFYDEILRAVWGYLSDKLRLPTSELSRDNVSQILERRGIQQQDIDSLLKLLDDAEFAKYSPASLRRPMSDIYSQATDILNMLEDAFAKAGSKTSSENNDGNGSGNGDASGSALSDGSASATASDSSVSTTGGKVLGAMLAMLVSAGCFAADNATLVTEADSAYNGGNYEKAIELYSSVIQSNGATAPLLFNLGCSYYKTGNEGEARVALERAKKLDPSNDRINQNLRYISQRVEDANKAELKGRKGDVAPEPVGFFGRIHDKVAVDTSSDTWAQFAAMAFILMLLAIAVYLFISDVRLRKIGFFSGIIFLFFTVVFVILSEMAASHFMSHDEAVVTSFKTTLTSDPHDAGKKIGAPLSRGTKLEILESQLNSDGKIGWYKVELNSKNIGWVSASDITII